MTTETHTPQENSLYRYLIESDSIEEAIAWVLPRIRNISKAFYKKEIRNDLEKNGKSIVDSHAGQGVFYLIKLNEKRN